MPLKAPEASAYQWGGCYVGVNLGGGTSGTNFGSTVDPGTYLAAGDAATVSGSGAGGANADGVRPADRPDVTCSPARWSTAWKVTSTISTAIQSSPTTPTHLADGNTFAISQSLTTNFLATVRPRIGIAADRNLAYITGGAAFTSISYTEGYVDANAPPGTGSAAASQITRGLDCRRRLGICLR